MIHPDPPRERASDRTPGRDRAGRKDGEDRWVKLPPATMAALRAHLEAIDLEGSVKEWTPAARQLVFPNTVGRRGPRWVKDQLGHVSVAETEGAYGHLERERHERRVDLDTVLGGVNYAILRARI
jgi:integrase